MEQGFERLRTDMGSIATDAERMGKRINDIFHQIDASSPIASAQRKVQNLAAQLEATTAEFKIAISEDDDGSAQRLERKMTSLYDRLEAAREKLAREVAKAADKQAAEEEKAAEKSRKAVEQESKAKKKAMDDAYRDATKGARHFGARFREILSGALVFNLLSAGLRTMTSYFGDALKTNEQYRESVARLKGALLTAFQPIYEYVLPAVVHLINFLTVAAQKVSQFFATLTGKSTSSMAKNAEEMYKTINNVNEAGKAAGNASENVEDVGKKAKKTGKEIKKASRELMGFDQLNKLSEKDSGTFDDYEIPEIEKPKIKKIEEELSDTIAPEFGDFDLSQYEAILTEIEALFDIFIFAFGVILAFSGANVPLGIALMAAGVIKFGYEAATNWNAMKETLQGPIGLVFGLVSAASLVLGAILAFSGVNIPLGIALMAMGAAGLATYWAANWDAIKNALEGPIGLVTALVSASFLALGAILAFSGINLPVGLVLMGLGAVGLVSSIAANWDTLKNYIEPAIEVLRALLFAAGIVIGAILAFSGASIPLGIGLIAAGAAGLAKKIKPKWDTIEKTLEGPVGAVTAALSAALLVLGGIIAFSGAGLPLGIALLAAGAAGLVTTAAVNWNTIKGKVSTVIAGIMSILSGSALVLGTILCLSGAGIPLGLPLIAMGLAGSVTAWNLNDNPLTRWVKNLANGIINIINRITTALNEVFHIRFPGLRIGKQEVIPRFEVRMVNIPKIPLLAQGAVIPPNAPFLAMLGDQRNGNNIEAPEDLIRKIVREEAGSNAETLTVLRAILSAVQASGNNRIVINGRDVFQTVVDENNRATQIYGTSPLKV